MTLFTTLAQELKDAIIIYLSLSDKVNLSASCKAWRAATLSDIYSHITMTWKYDFSDEREESPNITSLLLSLIRRPSLTDHLKSLSLYAVSYWQRRKGGRIESRRPSIKHHFDEDAVSLLEKTVKDSHLPHPELWLQATIKDRDLGAVIALIILQCNRLESLTIDIDFLFENEWFSTMIRHVVEAPHNANLLPRLEELTCVSVTCTEDYIDRGLQVPRDVILYLLYLPNLTHIMVENASLCDYDWDPVYSRIRYHDGHENLWSLKEPPLAASLVSLKLNRVLVRPRVLEMILKHTPNLESLSFHSRVPSSIAYLDLDVLRWALDHVRSTLNHLEVSFDIWGNEALDVESLAYIFNGNLGSLRGFTALTEIKVSLSILYGQGSPAEALPLATILPPKLKRLTFTENLRGFNAVYEWQKASVMMALFRNFIAGNPVWKEATPELEQFVLDSRSLEFYEYRIWLDDGQGDELIRMCESNGLQGSILYCSSDTDDDDDDESN
jgi:hypothetical protein